MVGVILRGAGELGRQSSSAQASLLFSIRGTAALEARTVCESNGNPRHTEPN